ncbi:unnamed protein product, partial [Discosporangium mesarthrocarpum]
MPSFTSTPPATSASQALKKAPVPGGDESETHSHHQAPSSGPSGHQILSMPTVSIPTPGERKVGLVGPDSAHRWDQGRNQSQSQGQEQGPGRGPGQGLDNSEEDDVG